jgi:hypothetical protein
LLLETSYYKKTHPVLSFGKADLKAAYSIEIGRLSFGSASDDQSQAYYVCDSEDGFKFQLLLP